MSTNTAATSALPTAVETTGKTEGSSVANAGAVSGSNSFWGFLTVGYDEIVREPLGRLFRAGGSSSKEEYVLRRVFAECAPNDPDAVLALIDRIGWTERFLMNVGDVKGRVLDTVVQQVLQGQLETKTNTEKEKEKEKEARVTTIVECGGYVGYSAVRIARWMARSGLAGRARLISLEMDPFYAAIAARIVDHAGLSPFVTIRVGTAESLLPGFAAASIDMLFLDHWKDRYLPDAQLAVRLGVLRPGARVLADNVIFPGTPDYLLYVRSSTALFRTRFWPGALEYRPDVHDGMEDSLYLPGLPSDSAAHRFPDEA